MPDGQDAGAPAAPFELTPQMMAAGVRAAESMGLYNERQADYVHEDIVFHIVSAVVSAGSGREVRYTGPIANYL